MSIIWTKYTILIQRVFFFGILITACSYKKNISFKLATNHGQKFNCRLTGPHLGRMQQGGAARLTGARYKPNQTIPILSENKMK